MQDLIFYVLLATSFCGWFVFVFCALWYWQRERRERTRIRQTKADIADIMLLFQTMRDVVMQQKQLANDFNEELERKVGGVKQILTSAIDKNERLYERQRDLERELEETRAELQSVQRQISYLPPVPDSHSAPPRPVSPVREAALEGARGVEAPFVALPGEDAPSALETATDEPAMVNDEPRPVTHSSVEPMLWEQVDLVALSDTTVLGLDQDDDDEELLPPPADAAAAREAFRALLDLSSGEPAPDDVGKMRNQGNGGANIALQQRIVEYAEAGMSVGDIARELGIGKGEVRLMLSLAKPGQA